MINTLDNLTQAMVGRSAYQLCKKYAKSESDGSIPTEITNLIGNKYAFKVAIDDYNDNEATSNTVPAITSLKTNKHPAEGEPGSESSTRKKKAVEIKVGKMLERTDTTMDENDPANVRKCRKELMSNRKRASSKDKRSNPSVSSDAFLTRHVRRTPKQSTNLATSPLAFRNSKTPTLEKSNVLQMPAFCNTITTPTSSWMTPNSPASIATRGQQVIPVASTRKRQSPLNDVSKGAQKNSKYCCYTNHSTIKYTNINLQSSNSSGSSGHSNSKNPIDRDIMNEVKDVLDTLSDLVKTFRRARDRYNEDSEQNIRIKLVAKRGKDGRTYNLLTSNEVAGLIVGDFDTCIEQRDIMLEKHREGLERINIFHPLYLPLKYPLLMPYAQDGTPSIERLSFHLPGEQQVLYDENSDLETVLHKPSVGHSMFEGWMKMNELYPVTRELTYAEFPTKYVWNAPKRIWTLRKQGKSIGRIHNVPISTGDAFYYRMILNGAKGCRTHDEIKKVNGVVYPTYKEACYATGLLEDDKEYIECIKDATHWATAEHLREIFVTLLSQKELTLPLSVWLQTWHLLAGDVQFKRWPEMPYPDERYISEFGNWLIYDELDYNPTELQSEYERLYVSSNTKQKSIYHTIMNFVETRQGGVYFVYDYEGTGKTFLWKTLAVGIKRKGDIVLNVASSGIASLLILGGRTAHSRFNIPINIDEMSTCSICLQSDLGALLKKCKIIIWDEAPMTNKLCFEALDRTLRYVLCRTRYDTCETPFGNMTMVFGANMRLTVGASPKDVCEIRDFAKWILKVRDRELGEEMVYLSCDSIDKTEHGSAIDESIFSPEFINGLKFSGVPNHKLALKAKIINGTHFGKEVIIPRLRITPSDKRLPIKIVRKQYPLSLSFVMTINKSHGQSLSKVGLYLPCLVFTHGQLYVAFSSVKKKRDLKVVVCDEEGTKFPWWKSVKSYILVTKGCYKVSIQGYGGRYARWKVMEGVWRPWLERRNKEVMRPLGDQKKSCGACKLLVAELA
uniref:ATP-dependent DNA helicase n=1 Tax=Tanacetum cinerariifolium TaxID=118510 RepID=A0A699GN95_TANCI|nr:ATP-dependent DNA helicase PIF1-like [Tanacetum cinerariifolium]